MCFPCSYELMQKCWSLDPDQRPTPIDIVASLTPLDSPAQDKLKEIVEEDCKTNGVKANGRHYLSEYYNCPLVRQTVVSFFFYLKFPIMHRFMTSHVFCTYTPPEGVQQGQKVICITCAIENM